MNGGVIIARNLWNDAAFQNDPFSEREAWIWMICEAQWKPRDRRVGKVIVHVDRGQLAHSTRFLADAWKWSHAKVRRFLDRLEKLKMIRRESGTGVSVITLCKYSDYQLSPRASGTEAAQKRHRSGTNLNKDEIKEEGNKKGAGVSFDISDGRMKGETNGGNVANNQQFTKGPKNRHDPALEQIARLAGLSVSQGDGGL